MNRVSIFIEASVTCPRCEAPIHLNGLVESVQCEKCQNVLPLPPAAWQQLIAENISEAAQMDEGTGQESTQWGGLNARLKYGRLTARCEKCKTPFPHDDPSTLTGQMFCGQCGQKTGARAAPAWAKQLHPAIISILGESLPGPAAPLAGAQPVAIHCIGCGGKLTADGSSREITCTYCQAQNFLPDQLWLKLHPASTRQPWFLQLDLGSAVGVLPDDCWDFCGVAYVPTGGPVVAYGDSDDNMVIDALDPNGLVQWRKKDLKFSDDSWLIASPSCQYLALVDPENKFVQYIDPASGNLLWRATAETVRGDYVPPDRLRPLELDSYWPVALDVDGTLIVMQYGSDERNPLLTRYAADGRPIPMWGANQGGGGFFSRLAGDPWDEPEWGDISHGLLVPPDEAKMAVGNDGLLYLVGEELEHMAAYDRNGQMVQNRPLTSPAMDEVKAFGASSNGILYVLCEMDGGGKSDWSHLLRIYQGHQPEIIAGPATLPNGAVIGEYDEKMSVAPSGTCYIAHGLDSLRVVDGYGRLVWRSPATLRNDENN